jgi:hypothetical protein
MSASITQLTVLIGAVLTFVGMMVIGVNALYTVSWNAGWAILGVFTSLAFIATLAGLARAVVVARGASEAVPKIDGASAASVASASTAPAAVAVQLTA